MFTDWHEKHIVITGGTRGLGYACVQHFLNLGANVHFTYLRSKRTAQSIQKAFPDTAHAYALNLSKPDSVLSFCQNIKSQCNRIDGLIFNANSGVYGQLIDATQKQFNYTFQCGVYSLHTITLELKHLFTSKSSLVAISSQGARKPIQNYGLPGIAKSAVEALIKYLAVRLAPLCVRCNVVCPGPFLSDSLKKMPDYASRLSQFNRQKLLDIELKPENITDAIVFLISNQSHLITGQVLTVDGGANTHDS